MGTPHTHARFIIMADDTGMPDKEEDPYASLVEIDEIGDGTLEEYVRETPFVDADMSMIMRALTKAQSWIPPTQQDLLTATLEDLHIVTREEEDRYLRWANPCSDETECMRGDECEGTFWEANGERRPLVAHPTPKEALLKPPPPMLCIMCKRYMEASYFYCSRAESDHQAFTGTGNEFKSSCSHGNYANQPGEYDIWQCVPAGTRETHGMFFPVPVHCCAWYTPEMGTDNILRFRQTGYRLPSDF